MTGQERLTLALKKADFDNAKILRIRAEHEGWRNNALEAALIQAAKEIEELRDANKDLNMMLAWSEDE